jgi:Fe2+ or Zn2+ uptake regulation protein
MSATETRQDLLELKRSLNQRGRRMTHQREAILALLREDKSHPTAEEIHRRVQAHIPRISLGTVYRNLQVLVEEGCVVRLPADVGSHRYDGDVTHHHHALCRECGRIVDVYEDPGASMVRRAEKATGFRIEAFRIEFIGLCGECSGS